MQDTLMQLKTRVTTEAPQIAAKTGETVVVQQATNESLSPFNASHVPRGYADLLHSRLIKGAGRSRL